MRCENPTVFVGVKENETLLTYFVLVDYWTKHNDTPATSSRHLVCVDFVHEDLRG